jgi:MFS family permease
MVCGMQMPQSKWNTLVKSIGVNRAVFALSLARMADAMGNSILFIIIPLYVAKLPEIYFNLPLPVLVGLLISLYGFVNSALQPLMGALSDRLGRRKILIQLGLSLVGIGTLTFIFAQRFIDLLVLRTLQGVGVAITIPASMALMAVITEKETRGGSMGFYSTMRILGFCLGPLIGGFLQVHFGFNAAFYAGAGFSFLAMLLVQLWVHDAPVAKKAAVTKKFQIIDPSLLSAGILSAGLATFVMANGFSMVTTLENEFNARLDMTALGFGVAFSVLMVGRLVFQIPLGRLSDFIGRKPLVVLGLLLMAPATALLGEVNDMPQLILTRLFQGIASACIAAPAFAVAADLSQVGGEGRQMSVITMGFGLGLAAGPLLAGLLAVLFFELPFLVGGLMSLAAALIVLRYMPETVQRKATMSESRVKGEPKR